MSSICPEYIENGLEISFKRILRERMQGLPFVNPALEVKAIGFRPWNQCCLGVLITPWFMNLMVLPNEGDDWQDRQLGTKELQIFPSGPYEFVLGEEDGIGRYQMCSLFSPMFEFADQRAAEATAVAVMEGVMETENRDSVSTREKEIEAIWNGEQERPGQAAAASSNDDDKPSPTLDERMEQPVSRRDLLRGNLRSETNKESNAERL